MKSFLFSFLLGAIFAFLMLLFSNQSYRLKPNAKVSSSLQATLKQLGEKALETKDVPVASVLTYYDTIIGVGYNTVKRDHNLGGHAEINALSDAYLRFGSMFSTLNRDHLVLYSTFEPCEMCKGALVHYDIKHVQFELNKTMANRLKSQIKTGLYEWHKTHFYAPNLQEKLFLKHPDYPDNRATH